MFTTGTWQKAHQMAEELARHHVSPQAALQVAHFAETHPDVELVLRFLQAMSEPEQPLAENGRDFQQMFEVYSTGLTAFAHRPDDDLISILYWVAYLSSYYRSGSAEIFYKQMGQLGSMVMPSGNPIQPTHLRNIVPGMVLEGTVKNICSYGVFVDVGVKRDGLIHISELSPDYVHDPAEVVCIGERVTVKVLAVDPKRQKLSLSIRALAHPSPQMATQSDSTVERIHPEPLNPVQKFHERYDATMNSTSDRKSSPPQSNHTPDKKRPEKRLEFSGDLNDIPPTVDPRFASLLVLKKKMTSETK
ncbi:MAG: S1 RNA-binding domain-containing protein [Gemmatimonadetes bacterium]|nr:MAG: S1 RNA-binding domain-containing protein [Gemmatimonadota bacterium]